MEARISAYFARQSVRTCARSRGWTRSGGPYADGVRPLNRYSVTAMVVAVGLALLVRPGALTTAGLVLLALAVHLWSWDPERDEMFADDWVELGGAMGSLVCLVAGLGLVAVGLI